jgi:LCP family protein required for cell wall assembly
MKMKKLISMVSKIVNIAFIIISILLAFNIAKLNIIPNKYMYMFIIVLIVLNFVLLYFIWFSKKIISKILSILIVTIMIFILGYLYVSVNNVGNFLNSLGENDLKIEYRVVVLKNRYKNISDLARHKIGYLEENTKYIRSNLDFDYSETIVNNLNDLGSSLLNKNVSAIVVESNVLQSLCDEIDGFKDEISIIGGFYVTDGQPILSNNNYKFSLTPFIFYISGIDQYGDINTVRGRSDVNILVVVNPVTYKILLVNTPRDYYIKLHSTGALDKLTHAGIYGINESLSTLEDLYDIDINYYLRVNFNTISDLVDALGGIDIYSDSDFTAWTDRTCHITSGEIKLDGRCALAYARERKTYSTGDRHRGENQQEIISTIIRKVSSSKTLLTKHAALLATLTGKFKSNASVSLFTDYIKYQISDMKKWGIESISVNGADSMNYTYSYGTSMQLYVMNPDYNTVTIASSKIKEYLKVDNK